MIHQKLSNHTEHEISKELHMNAKPPIYLHLIFAILQFEISSLMNWIFRLFQT